MGRGSGLGSGCCWAGGGGGIALGKLGGRLKLGFCAGGGGIGIGVAPWLGGGRKKPPGC